MSEEWNNLKYEIEHQDYLKEQYENAIAKYGYHVWTRKIVCGGCGKVFYTRVLSKKYCGYKSCFFAAQRKKRESLRADTVCLTCGEKFTPKRNDAKYCCNACRQKAYRQNVTDMLKDQNDPLPQS